MRSTVILEAPWREPAEALGALGERPWALGLLTGGEDPVWSPGWSPGWSYVAAEPAATLRLEPGDPADPIEALAALAGPAAPGIADGPPFQGGVAGLLSYDLA